MVDWNLPSVWIGRVDRVNSSSNAIILANDAEPCQEDKVAADHVINLGPLPRGVVNKQVIFVYEGGTYGFCISRQWVSEAYIDEMLSRVDLSLEETDLRSLIIDSNSLNELPKGYDDMVSRMALSLKGVDLRSTTIDANSTGWLPEGTACVALEWVDIETVHTAPWVDDDLALDDKNSRLVARIHPEDADLNKDQLYLGIIAGPVPAGGLPCTVQVEKMNRTCATVKAQTVESASSAPEVGEVCSVQTEYVSTCGTIAVYQADCSLPVLIRDVEYPVGKIINARIIKKNSAHLIAEQEVSDPKQSEVISGQNIDIGSQYTPSQIFHEGNVVDIRPLPAGTPQPNEIVLLEKKDKALLGAWNVQAVTNGSDDLKIGETIDGTIALIEKEQFVCFKNNFPVVCKVDISLPAGLEDNSVKITIDSIAPDRAIATLAASPFKEKDIVTIEPVGFLDNALFSINNRHIIQVPSSRLISLKQTFRAAINSSGPVSQASVGALPDFNSVGESKTLVHLPSSTGDTVVTNGVPVDTSKLPDLTKSVTLGIENINSDHIVPSVTALPDTHTPENGDHLIVTIDKPAVTTIVSAVGEGLPIELLKPTSLQVERTYAQIFDKQDSKLRAVTTAIADNTSTEALVEQLQLSASLMSEREYAGAKSVLSAVRSQLPSGYPVADAIVNARYTLLRASDLLSSISDCSPIEFTYDLYDETDDINENNISNYESQLLEVYNLEIKATIDLIEAYQNVNVDTVNQLQAIARGAEGREPVREALQKLRTAAQRMDSTEHSSESPSAEIMYFLRRFEEVFPYPTDELTHWRENHSPHASNDEWLGTVLPVDLESIGSGSSCFELKPDDTHSQKAWKRPSSDDEVTLRHTTSSGQKKHKKTAQESLPEGSPSRQGASVHTDKTYENLDGELVNALLHNGRASLRSLADELDVSVTTVSNHLADLEQVGVVEGFTPTVDYNKLGYDVTAILQLKVRGEALPTVTDSLSAEQQIVSVYEVTGDYDVIAVGKFKDTDDMNDHIKTVLSNADINESNTSVVLNIVTENRSFELETGDS